MTPLLASLLYGTLAGAMIPLGGWLASIEHIRPDWLERDLRHAVIAFGGGVLIAAVAFVLVPEAEARLPVWLGLVAFLAGGAVFAALEQVLDRSGTKAAQLVAMTTDFLPEALALGAVIANGGAGAPLIAAFIALQNLPEAFNAWREMATRPGMGRLRLHAAFCAIAALGPIAALAGHLALGDRPLVLGSVMMGAAGGILYIVFRDIAPAASVRPAGIGQLGAVAGFALGLAGHLLIGG